MLQWPCGFPCARAVQNLAFTSPLKAFWLPGTFGLLDAWLCWQRYEESQIVSCDCRVGEDQCGDTGCVQVQRRHAEVKTADSRGKRPAWLCVRHRRLDLTVSLHQWDLLVKRGAPCVISTGAGGVYSVSELLSAY